MITKQDAAPEGDRGCAGKTELQHDSDKALVVTCLSDVEPQAVEWIWPNRIARGKVNLIAGDPGLGKSMLCLHLAAKVSNGGSWADDANAASERGSVILFSAEDDVADTIRPRIDAAGADASRVFAVQGVRRKDRKRPAYFDLQRDLSALEAEVRRHPDASLVIIDPITAYLGKIDSHRNADVRGVLAPLAQLAARWRVAVVCVTHLTKSYGGKAIYRATGSLAFAAAARVVWLVMADPEHPKNRRLFLPVKFNIGPPPPALAFSVIENSVGAAIAWESGTVKLTANEAIEAEERALHQRSGKLTAAKWFLRGLLANGAVAEKRIEVLAKESKISMRTLRRAKSDLEIVSERLVKAGATQWWWSLPVPTQPNGEVGNVGHLATDREVDGQECQDGHPGDVTDDEREVFEL